MARAQEQEAAFTDLVQINLNIACRSVNRYQIDTDHDNIMLF